MRYSQKAATFVVSRRVPVSNARALKLEVRLIAITVDNP